MKNKSHLTDYLVTCKKKAILFVSFQLQCCCYRFKTILANKQYLMNLLQIIIKKEKKKMINVSIDCF